MRELPDCPRFGPTPTAPWRLRLLGALAGFLLKLYAWSLPTRREGEEPLREGRDPGKKYIFCFFHGRQVLCAPKITWVDAAIMISRSSDGELLTRALAYFGHRGVRGSSGHGGRDALQGMLESIRDGWDAGMAVDGSRGPRGRLKVGSVVLAQRTGSLLVPVGTSSRWARIFHRAWDRFLLPLPFSPAALVYGEPVAVPAEADRDEVEAIRARLEAALWRATERADALCGRATHDLPDPLLPASDAAPDRSA